MAVPLGAGYLRAPAQVGSTLLGATLSAGAQLCEGLSVIAGALIRHADELNTLIDALAPVAEALQQAAEEDAGFATAGQRALLAARAGLQATIPLRAGAGRANRAGDRTVGIPDVEATALVIALEALME